MAREGVTVAADGTIPGVRWLIDHDRQLKITLAECSACHTRVRPDGSAVRGAQRNLQWGSLPQFSFDALGEIRRREGPTRPPNEIAYASYGVRLPSERLEPAGYARTAHPGPPVRVELGGRRQARAHRVSEDALKRQRAVSAIN
jgi:hypothetical protein